MYVYIYIHTCIYPGVHVPDLNLCVLMTDCCPRFRRQISSSSISDNAAVLRPLRLMMSMLNPCKLTDSAAIWNAWY